MKAGIRGMSILKCLLLYIYIGNCGNPIAEIAKIYIFVFFYIFGNAIVTINLSQIF